MDNNGAVSPIFVDFKLSDDDQRRGGRRYHLRHFFVRLQSLNVEDDYGYIIELINTVCTHTMEMSAGFDLCFVWSTSDGESDKDGESDEDGLSEMVEDYCAAFKATSCIARDSSGNGTSKGKKKRKKRGRGPTQNLKFSKEFRGGEKYEISWLNGRPVGPHARALINECTKLVREQQNVPLKFTDWKKVPDINKRKLFDKVLEYFKVEGREKEVWRQMGNSYSNYRDFLKTNWFKPYGEATEEARANVPPGVERDDWNCLVDLWTNKDYMDMCLINKNNRSKNDIVHTSGSKSFQQRSAEEKEKTGDDPTRVQLFDITHVQRNGQAVNEPTQDALMALRDLTAQVNEGALHMSQDQMFTEVFGPERHGRVRGYGAGITPTKLKGSSSSILLLLFSLDGIEGSYCSSERGSIAYVSRPNVFGPERHGRVRGYGAGITPTKLKGSSSSIMHDLEKRLQESEQKRVEADAEANAKVESLKGEVDQLKSVLEQQASQMVEQSRRFEDMMAQVMSCMTSQSAQSNRGLRIIYFNL
ncbi:hypothetical protein CFP56_022729 [Quercus suber]|uniref:Transposase n=1 Tax=Quercus suber TaxID=58331 RepID=A0AAW0KAU5_QUESU